MNFRNYFNNTYRRYLWLVFSIIFLLLLFWFSLPSNLLRSPHSTAVYSGNGQLLAATVAADGQYRFPPMDNIPDRFTQCIVQFEDKRFYSHVGVSFAAIVRATWQNIRAKQIVSGASTITMQVVRLHRKGKPRSLFEKLIEAAIAIRLEVAYSKHQILCMYASHAPFGGNVVGLEAAAWRYYGRSAIELSWAEAAALAVLPNSPALVHPGRNQQRLMEKRNGLLKRLMEKGKIDSLTFSLSLQEPLPGEPRPIPSIAPHILTRAIADGKMGTEIRTTIDPFLQQRAMETVSRHNIRLRGNQIHNAALLVLDIETGNALAYVGNTQGEGDGAQVDIIRSARSTGSILKPFLYAFMLHEGSILPRTLVADVLTQIGGFSPKNFLPDYDGAVPASRALARSLNVPAVRMLQQHGVEKFLRQLQSLGLTTINRSAENYGLSLILWGAEATLWDLAGVYASMARTLNHYRILQSQYCRTDFRPANYVQGVNLPQAGIPTDNSTLSAAAIYLTFEAMREVARPEEEAGWQFFSSTRSIAWKTGTSYGHRDAWAIGLNPRHVVAVWVGNASGEGRPNLTGISAAAPIMFDMFGYLPSSSWFQQPFDDMVKIPVCRYSGHRASNICEPVDSVWIPVAGIETIACPYHQLVHLNPAQNHRVTDRCMSVNEMVTKSWFVLPPAMEWFYKSKNAHYRILPPYLAGCRPDAVPVPMALLYPRIDKSAILIPRDFDGKRGEAIFEVAHTNPTATIFWHLNKDYIGSTQTMHKMALNPPVGSHTLTLVDSDGNTLVTSFKVEK